jgi:hypothetical protein
VPIWVAFTVKYAAIRNTGTSDFVIASVAMSRDSTFAITNNPSGTIAKGGSCKVSLAFTRDGRLRSRFLNHLLQRPLEGDRKAEFERERKKIEKGLSKSRIPLVM